MCKSFNLDRLARDISSTTSKALSVFFTAKTHKPNIPFRTIVSERGTWQLHVSRFILKSLKSLVVTDPFLTKSSDDVVAFLRNNQAIGPAFSVDVEDLFYSIPHSDLFRAVRMCVDENGSIPFQNAVGISVEHFLTLLETYLNSTFISFDEQLFLQKRGICIGSCIAPLLCNIFLGYIDKALEEAFRSNACLNILTVFRYMDDFLIVFNEQGTLTTCDAILDMFKRLGKGLSFTHELPLENTLRFLDLSISFDNGHACWQYFPRAQKGLVPYDSSQSKIVKRGVAMLCLESALRKSCVHKMQDAFDNQISRLKTAGFPDSMVTPVVETLLQKVKGSRREARTRTTTFPVRPEVVPYIHKVSHNLRKVAGRYGVPLVFSAPFKLARLCPRTSREPKRVGCGKNHAKPYAKCSTGVVYEIPLTCGKSYIGQTGRCLNDRAREHEQKLKKEDVLAHLPAHCKDCACEPRFQGIKILGRSQDQTARELLEAYFIRKKSDDCVSDTSIRLFQSEMSFFDKWLPR